MLKRADLCKTKAYFNLDANLRLLWVCRISFNSERYLNALIKGKRVQYDSKKKKIFRYEKVFYYYKCKINCPSTSLYICMCVSVFMHSCKICYNSVIKI